jgi:PTH1 family peptidyl-tRNA hydrolase
VKLIAGLGNPGTRYQLTRHNLGFLVLDRLAETNRISVGQMGFDARFGKGMIADQAVLLIKPQTFMNLSGASVRKFFEYYRINIDDVIVVHDDLDLPFGTIRFKAGGGHGGHKGLISIIDHLGMTDFSRVRLGIGKPVHKGMVDSYVLSPFSPDEMIVLPRLTSAAATALTDMLSLGIQAAMGMHNGKTINNFEEV